MGTNETSLKKECDMRTSYFVITRKRMSSYLRGLHPQHLVMQWTSDELRAKKFRSESGAREYINHMAGSGYGLVADDCIVVKCYPKVST